jgi:2-(1,2-epoxy-1,2-dihydrophenyl)acetyl-CoA isomerase
MSYQTIALTRSGGVARLTLNRPEKFNAFNSAMHAELRAAVAELRATVPRVLIVSGVGKAFCSGQDLSERELVARGEKLDLGASLDASYNVLIKSLAAFEFPIIARVQGVAAGAGASLALACDLVVAGRSAKFTQAFVRIGLMPDAGGSWQLPRRVGLARAMGMALLGEPVSGEQAADWGLIWQCVDDAALDATVDAMAATLVALPTAALAAIKRGLHAAVANTLHQQLDVERDLQRELGYSNDFREGVTAFLGKRAPRFGGDQ